jgi:serine/threonine-protein kinase
MAVEEVILKALAKDPKQRFATAREMALALQAAVPNGEPVALGHEASVSEFAPTLPLFPFGRRGQRQTALLLAAGGLIVLGLMGVGWWWAQNGLAFPRGLAPTPSLSPTAGATATLPTVASTAAANLTATPTAPAPLTPAPTLTLRATPTAPPSPTPLPTLGIGSVISSSIDGMVQMYVPAGTFLMGSTVEHDKNAINNEKPQNVVTLSAFWIDQKEVTNAQYALCVQAEVCPPPRQLNSATRNPYYGVDFFAQHPVVYVQWYDARSYCNWAERRLPTEAEWEKAARGPNGQIYPWGDTFPDGSFLNFDSRVVGDTSAVGSYILGISPYGALDMAGNVWEWVADTYRLDYYDNSPRVNPTGPETGSLKIYRGGAWNEPLWNVRAAIRMPGKPGDAFPNVGFRCAMDAP